MAKIRGVGMNGELINSMFPFSIVGINGDIPIHGTLILKRTLRG